MTVREHDPQSHRGFGAALTRCVTLLPGLTGPAGKISSSLGEINSGKARGQDIESLNTDVDAVQRGAQDEGVPAPDRIPSDAQLASGGS